MRLRMHIAHVIPANTRHFYERTRTCDRSACVGFSRFVEKKWFCDFNAMQFNAKKKTIAVIFEVICLKKLGKGPFKSLDFQCDLYASQL